MFEIEAILEVAKFNRMGDEQVTPKRLTSFRDALVKIDELTANKGTIRKAELEDLKYPLNEIAENAWTVLVENPFVYSGKWETLGELKDTHYNYHLYGLHAVISMSKKVGKIKFVNPNQIDLDYVAAMKKAVDLLLPVAEALKAFKDEGRIVAGRAPRAEPIPENPNKDVKTCPCCLRQIAVFGGKEAKGQKAGKMVHHGFERPGTGEQTQSCYGIDFHPLEVSTEGLVWYIGVLDSQIDRLTKSLKNAPTLTEIQNPKFDMHTRQRLGTKYNVPMTIKKSETDPTYWNRQIEIIVVNLESKIDYIQSDRNMRQKIVDNWQPGKGIH